MNTYTDMSRRLTNAVDFLVNDRPTKEQMEDIVYGTFREALELGSKLQSPKDVKVWLNKLGF